MQRMLVKALIVATILFGATFAGMALFGMGDMMAMGTGHGIDTTCLSHCIGAVTSLSATAPFSVPVAGGFIGTSALLFAWLLLGVRRPDVALRRSREGIGKFLLHQSLSTIVLRN